MQQHSPWDQQTASESLATMTLLLESSKMYVYSDIALLLPSRGSYHELSPPHLSVG